MRQPQFLKQNELQVMQADFNAAIASPQATLLTFGFQVGVGSPTIDPAYHITDYSGGKMTVSVTGYGLQKIVSKRDEYFSRFGVGVLEAGDCIFYFANSIDLSQGIEGTMEVIDPDGQHWTPLPRNLTATNKYLSMKVGDKQIAQVLGCKIRK